jgi:uncharacterized membrane protein
MRNGVLIACSFTPEQMARAMANFKVVCVSDRTGDDFGRMLNQILEQSGPFDLVIIDPAFAYLGGEANAQAVVSKFMRELLLPAAQKHKVGIIVAHHTNKPPNSKDRPTWSAGELAYLGAGSAEWCNAARAVLALRPTAADGIFELRAAKRGGRLGWVDATGARTTVRYIGHDKRPGVIAWREVGPEEYAEATAPSKPGRPAKVTTEDAVRAIGKDPGWVQRHYAKALARALGCSETAAQSAIKEAERSGLVVAKVAGKAKHYELTDAGKSTCKANAGAICTTTNAADRRVA